MQILILEDDPDFGRELKYSLEDEGFEVSWHTRANDALSFLSEHPVDLIITDMMIKVDGKLVNDGGIRLISSLKQMSGHPAPIIAISGSFMGRPGFDYFRSSASTVGASAILPKPFEMAELFDLIDQQLKNA